MNYIKYSIIFVILVYGTMSISAQNVASVLTYEQYLQTLKKSAIVQLRIVPYVSPDNTQTEAVVLLKQEGNLDRLRIVPSALNDNNRRVLQAINMPIVMPWDSDYGMIQSELQYSQSELLLKKRTVQFLSLWKMQGQKNSTLSFKNTTKIYKEFSIIPHKTSITETALLHPFWKSYIHEQMKQEYDLAAQMHAMRIVRISIDKQQAQVKIRIILLQAQEVFGILYWSTVNGVWQLNDLQIVLSQYKTVSFQKAINPEYSMLLLQKGN